MHKKFITFVLAILMIVAFSVPAFAGSTLNSEVILDKESNFTDVETKQEIGIVPFHVTVTRSFPFPIPGSVPASMVHSERIGGVLFRGTLWLVRIDLISPTQAMGVFSGTLHAVS